MIPALFSGTAIPVLQQVASFTESRPHVLAGNLANFDTPGYLVRDLSERGFEARLRSAISRRDNELQARARGAGLSIPVSPGFAEPASAFAPGSLQHVNHNLEDLLHHDGSNVGIEQQVAEITKNQLRHNLALTIMNAQFRTLEAAISERA